jgi:two-component system sensor histidine kinase AtoS
MLDGEWINIEIDHKKRDGTVFPVEVSGGLLEFEEEKYILAFDKDITERKLAEVALQRAEQLVVVGEMAAGLAHEIKNPLAGIKVSIEVLAGELELAEEDREVFLKISDEINRIETLLKDLLNYAKPPTPQVMPLDVNRILESAIKTASLSLKGQSQQLDPRRRKHVEFIKELSDDLPRTVADSAQLQQVTLNLLLNAIYAIQGSGSISIKTSAGTNGLIRISVSDTGRGLDGTNLDRIFQPFFTTKPKGTGLGLSICKRLIEQQNGTIDVARNDVGGLRFTITLPIERESGSQLS